jgi:hypothetical protein
VSDEKGQGVDFVEQVLYAAVKEVGMFYKRLIFCECVWLQRDDGVGEDAVEIRTYDLQFGWPDGKPRKFDSLNDAVPEWSDLVGRKTA